MKAVQFARFGLEVLVEVLASPINPSEFLSFDGYFGSRQARMRLNR